MEKALLCPRTEICHIYNVYVDNTGDDRLGIIQVVSIEHRDFYSCIAMSAVKKLAQEKKLPDKAVTRLHSVADCLLIDQANKIVERRSRAE